MRTTTIILTLAAGLLAAPLQPAMAQVPSGDTGLGDARAHNQPTSRAISRGWQGGAPAGYGRSIYAHRGWGWHRHSGWRHHHRHW